MKDSLNVHEVQRYAILHNINTDIGRGRAWLRASLNERTLERALLRLTSSRHLLQFVLLFFYIVDEAIHIIATSVYYISTNANKITENEIPVYGVLTSCVISSIIVAKFSVYMIICWQLLTVFAYCCRIYYEDWAFLLDAEKSAMLPNMAAGK